MVQSIAEGGTADRDGRLLKGDFILAVDDRPLNGVSYETVRKTLCFLLTCDVKDRNVISSGQSQRYPGQTLISHSNKLADQLRHFSIFLIAVFSSCACGSCVTVMHRAT